MDKNKIPSHVLSTFSSRGEKIGDLISKYKVRILSLGGNRNGSYFTKETVDEMCKTLGGVPIIGYYSKENGDFTGHWGEYITKVINEETGATEVEYRDTVPYGFIPTDPKIEWETCEEDGEEKQYLVSEAYLWTGRYQELEVLDKGRPNNLSMELNPDPEKTTGDYITVTEKGIPQEYFKFDKTEFLGLCLLGKEVEPCFPSACFEPTMFSLESSSKLKETLAQMKAELTAALEQYSAKEEEKEPEEPAIETLESESKESITESEEEVNEEAAQEPAVFEEEGPTEEELQEIEEEGVQVEESLPEETVTLEDLLSEIKTLREEYNTMKEQYEALQVTHQELVDSVNKEKERGEKEQYLNENKDCISSENYDNLLNSIDSYTLEELKNKVQAVGYQYMASLLSNIKRGTPREGTSYTFTAEDTREEDLPEWVQRVREIEEEKLSR